MFAGQPYNPGRMRHRIAVQSYDVTRNPDGSEAKAWSDLFSIWVEFVNQAGREFAAAKAVNAELTHLLRTRYQDRLTTDKRVRYADPKTGVDRYFDIQAIVNPDENRWMLMIHCRELVGREVQS